MKNTNKYPTKVNLKAIFLSVPIDSNTETEWGNMCPNASIRNIPPANAFANPSNFELFVKFLFLKGIAQLSMFTDVSANWVCWII